MSLFEQFKMDENKELNGIRIEYGPNADKSVPTFIVARRGGANVRYAKAIDKETRQHRRQIELETLDNMVVREIYIRAFVDSVLLGWENVQRKNGEVVPFNRENAMKLMHDLPELYDDLSAQSLKASLYRADEQESDAKN